jgi:hypothetical protein
VSNLRSAGRCGGPRLPFDALERLVSGSCAATTARTLGVNARQVYRWRGQGLPWALADELACRIGLHPAIVWGAAWWSMKP